MYAINKGRLEYMYRSYEDNLLSFLGDAEDFNTYLYKGLEQLVRCKWVLTFLIIYMLNKFTYDHHKVSRAK